MGEREGEKEKWKENVVFLFFYCVCVCIKNGKGPVGGMLGLGQRDGVAYKRITPNIRQNKRTFFVFTSFSLCFSCFACCFCCCFSCTTSFWHFPTPLSLSYYHSSSKGCDLWETNGKKNNTSVCDPHTLIYDACAVKTVKWRWAMYTRQNPIPFRFISFVWHCHCQKCVILCPASFKSNQIYPLSHAAS